MRSTKPESDTLEFFCRHLVGLGVVYRHKNLDETALAPRFAISSGTLILVEDTLFFLTAGHVLEALDELRASDKVEIETAMLADTFGWKRISNHPIPFDLKNASWFCINDDELGLDFGIIPLGRHHARLLAKSGVVAMSEENWAHQAKVKFDKYVMLGFPTELTSERLSDSGDGIVEPVLFGVRRLDNPPYDRSPTHYPQFVGQLNPKLPLKSIEGMSGGLILGFRALPAPAYWIVALQSSWHQRTRTVYGCSLPTLASLLTKWMREAPAA